MHRRAADEQLAAGAHDARALGQRRAELRRAQVLEDGEGDDAVEEAIGERHLLHVGLHQILGRDAEAGQALAQSRRLDLEVEAVELIARRRQGGHEQTRAVADLEDPREVSVDEAQPRVEARGEDATDDGAIIEGEGIDVVVRHQRAARRQPQRQPHQY